MSTDRRLLEKMIGRALAGKGSHVDPKATLEGLDEMNRRPREADLLSK